MRILVATEQWYPDYVGGTARVVRETAVALASLGHTVTVLAPSSQSSSPFETQEAGVRVFRVIRRGLLPKTWTDPIRFRRALRHHLVGHDILLAHHAAAAAAATFPTRLAPTAYVFHASPLREARHRRRCGGLPLVERLRSLAVEPVLALCERLAAARCTRVLVLSEFSAQLIASDHVGAAKNVSVVGGGVDTKRYAVARDRDQLRATLGIAIEDRLAITVRRLAPRMGIENLIRAVAQLRRTAQPRLRLIVVGDGELRHRLEGLADELNLLGVVDFRGALADDEVIRLYQAADIFVLPTVAYEGFGMATVEALASGTPVVGTPVGATPELLAKVDPRLLTSGSSPTELAEAIDRALSVVDDSLRDGCRACAERHWSWPSVIQRWERELAITVVEGAA